MERMNPKMKAALKSYAQTIKQKGWKAGEKLIEDGVKNFGKEFKQWARAIGVYLRAKELLESK